MSSWNDSIHFCQWKGVSCGRRHQRVTVLNLQSQKLTYSCYQGAEPGTSWSFQKFQGRV
ncbi:hypothetical protein ACB098_11G147100 [Castanea mollissima]